MLALAQGGEVALLGQILSCMTVEWGFDESPSAESVMRRDVRDIEAATTALREKMIPALRNLNSTDEAERVFEALVAGRVPDGYRDEALMAETGWTWQELQDTPEDVARRMRVFLSVRYAVERGWESGS
ncbi:MAG: hypothetical protein QF898_02840 [SAR202 cluster bacterium]|nr:hypothetical protein [SAR202 cluster bacterium]MDP6714468.1 hypothetical protein [SAR202 cluster bacterium]